MRLAAIPDGDRVFLDANTLIYHFTEHPQFGPPCAELLDRIDRSKVEAFTAAHIVSEMAHRLMTIEASQLFGWPFAGIAARLRRHSQEIQNLPMFRAAVDELRKSRIQVYSVNLNFIADATILSQQFGLLSNDALLVAVMQHHGLVNLASGDSDFDRVAGITRFGPA
jgi:predicted nucleic acid-binding protein